MDYVLDYKYTFNILLRVIKYKVILYTFVWIL